MPWGGSASVRVGLRAIAVVLVCVRAESRASAASPADQQLALAGAGAVKMLVRGTGWVRVGQPVLTAAGLSPDVDPASLQLFADGVEQAIAVTGNGDRRFSIDEAIEFYGTGRDAPSTDIRTYWLVAGGVGQRVAAQTADAAGLAAPDSFVHTEALVARNIYLSAIRNGDVSNFYGAAVSTSPVTVALTVPHPAPGAADDAVLSVALQGVTATAHVVDVALNGVGLGPCGLDGQARATCAFPATGLLAGANSVTLKSRDQTDYTATERVWVSYRHAYAADGDALDFTAPAGAHLEVAGFSTADVRIADVSDPAHPVALAVTVSADGGDGTFRAAIDVPAGPSARALYAFTAAHILAPVAVQADRPSRWSASHDGELLILSHAAFVSALAPLVARRQAEGWTVQLADLQDVYDERGFGDKSPDAIRAFIQAAQAGWRVPPRFVLLVGDATFDPRNFLGRGDFDFAPTRLIDTSAMETASDDWFVDADLDGVPELAIGRWPVRTAAQAAALVSTTLAKGGPPDLARGALFVSDQDEAGFDFSGATAQAEASVAGRMPVELFRRGDPGATSAALAAKLNAGPFLVNYVGHGSVEVWDSLFDSTQAAALTNAHPSVYVIMNCLNGFFHDLYTTSMAESLLEAPGGGAVAVWASSTLSDFGPQPAFDQEFLMGIGRKSLGEAALSAKRGVTDLEARRTWLLFGDPTLFGTPSATLDGGAGTPDGAPDAAIPGRDAGSDTGGRDAGAPDTTTRDAATSDAVAHDAGGTDAALDASGDGPTPRPAGDGGCDCATGGRAPGAPSAIALGLWSLLAVGRRRHAKVARRPSPRWLRRAIAGLALALAVAASTRAQAAYSYRMDITLNRNRVGNTGAPTTLSNYPLLLDITSANLKTVANGGHVQNANGYDITFVGTDTTTCNGPSTCTFNYEIESYTATTGHVIAWVQIPALNTVSASSNQTIVVKYGDATISAPTQNVNGTWDTSFKSVWHLNQSSSPASDSTSSAASATFQGTSLPATATGLIGSGISTSGTTGDGYLDYRSATFNWTSSDTFTYEGWFNTTDSFGPLYSQRDNGAGNPVIDITVGYNGSTSSSGRICVLVRDDTGGTFAELNGGATVNDGGWHHFAVTRTAGTIQVYVDGSSIGSATGAGAAGSITTGASGSYQSIGREGNWVQSNYGTLDQRFLGATFDEFRISKTVRSADWLVTDYATQKGPAATFVIGSETLASCGDGTKVAGEGCDDGNFMNGDGCSSSCAVESGYSCAGTTPSVCTAVCGDAIVTGSEPCDDGNFTNGDGCTSSCTVESLYHCSGSPSVCAFSRFDYYKTITVDRTKVGTAASPTTLTNYPVLISVTDTSLKTVANGGRVRNTNGYDIIFRGLDTTTCGGPIACTFAHEIEKYDGTTGQLIAWVNVPALKAQTNSANTTFNILFGNAAITTSTALPTSTWDSNFTAVWHLNQDPTGTAPQMTDATSNANSGTATSVTTATGLIGSGVTTDGSTSYIAANSGTSLNTASSGSFTYSGWVKTSDGTGGIFSLRSSTNSNVVVDIMVGRDGSSTNANKLMALLRDDSGAGLADLVSTSSIADGAWHLVTVTHSGTSMQLYMDTTSIGTAVVSSSTYTTSLRNIGREGRWVQDSFTTTAEEYLAATLDEFRASSAVR
ncbi:MAG: C25 family cysteine peptidase, partial [Polyangia bacterium]